MRPFLLATMLLLPVVSHAISDKDLQNVADQLNKQTPMMVDEETRLDKVSAGSKRLTYYYTMINYSANDLDLNKFTDIQRDTLKKASCGPLKIFLTNNINVSYIYKGKQGKQLAEIILRASDCGF